MRFAFLLALVACSSPGEPVREWTLQVDGEITAVTLPGNLFGALPHRELDYTLRTTVVVDDRRTLVVPCFHGDLRLFVNDAPALDLGDTGVGEHRFVIEGKGAVTLTLIAHRDNLSTIGFGVAPYLSNEPLSARGTVASINRTLALFELGLIAIFGLLYFIMWLMGRRREDRSFVVFSVAAASAPLWQLGLLPTLFGPFAPAIPLLALAIAQIAVLYFIHDAFGTPQPPRWLVRAFAIVAIASLASPLHFLVPPFVTVALAIVTAIYVPYIFGRIWLQLRDPVHGRDLRILFGIMIVAGLGVLPDIIALFGGHSLIGGIHTISAGMVGCIFVQAILLSRSFVARQRELERQADELRRNAEDLRRQVAERSRDLTAALAELARRPAEPLVADRVIAGYRVIQRLGAGGMGTVYEVARTSDDERFALKTLRGRTAPEAMARFTREAQIAAELDHEHLVPVLDVGLTDDGVLYLVMPLVAGGSLEQQRSRFGDAAWATPILTQIAAGLAALHARGIVHRDLKPGNVLLSPAARIADFGLAGLDERGPSTQVSVDAALDNTVPAPTPSPPLTHAGDIFGTPRYMAPELATGVSDGGPPADIFAFGVIAYEMLANSQPFRTPALALRQNGEPIPAPALEALPTGLRILVGRCLDADPAGRPTAAELVTSMTS